MHRLGISRENLTYSSLEGSQEWAPSNSKDSDLIPSGEGGSPPGTRPLAAYCVVCHPHMDRARNPLEECVSLVSSEHRAQARRDGAGGKERRRELLTATVAMAGLNPSSCICTETISFMVQNSTVSFFKLTLMKYNLHTIKCI